MKLRLDSLALASAALLSMLALPGVATAAGVDDAKALVAEGRKAPSFTPPGDAFDAKACMAGKKVFVLPLTSENPFNVEIGKAQKEAAAAVGFDLKVSDNQLNVDQWAQAVTSASSS